MPSPTRQLTAIMFTDIVGYTALMGKDANKALEVLETSKSFQKKLVEKHHGKWLKEMGDGVLASFGSARDAVNCAIEIQKSARGELDEKLRIGIHLGDVTVEENDVHGDGVNIASRLESICDPGGIYISESIEKAIRGQEQTQTVDLGEVELKNVDYGVRTYAVQGTGLPIPNKRSKTKGKINPKLFWFGAVAAVLVFGWTLYPKINFGSENEVATLDKSIAVLPFSDMSPNRDQEYLGDGIAEEILNVLVKVEGLKVIGRTSSFSYKGKDTDLKTIGKELGVRTILEGSVRKDGKQIRITAQLINAADGSHIWSDTYERELKNIFLIQDELSQSIGKALFSSLGIIMENLTSNPYTVNENAYDLFLLGRYYQRQRENLEETAPRAIELLKQVIEIDHSFATAHAELAASYYLMGFFGLQLLDENIWERAEFHAKKALEIDPDNPVGLRSMGQVRRTRYWDWDGARFYLGQSHVSDPNDSETLRYLTLLKVVTNQLDSARYFLTKAFELNPLDRNLKQAEARLFYYERSYKKAEEGIRGAYKTFTSHPYLVEIVAAANREEGANLILDSKDLNLAFKAELLQVYQTHGWNTFLNEVYRLHEKTFIEANGDPHGINGGRLIFVHAAPVDLIFEKLAIQEEIKLGHLLYLLLDPIYDPIRDDPRFDELLVRMGLDKYK